jgi:hypothetical protein
MKRKCAWVPRYSEAMGAWVHRGIEMDDYRIAEAGRRGIVEPAALQRFREYGDTWKPRRPITKAAARNP